MIKDQAIAWNVKREFIPVHQMTGLLEATNLITSLGAGTPVFQEVLAAAELAGLAINQAGDEIYHMWKIPWDLDRDMPIQMRILFFHASTDTDNPDWLIAMKGLAAQAAVTDAKSTPDVTFTFPALAVAAVANALEKTAWISSGSNSGLGNSDLFALLGIECNGLGSATGDEITLMGIEIAYTIKACGDSNHRDNTKSTVPSTVY